MNLALKIIARLGLVITIFPSFVVLTGAMELSTAKWIMMVGTLMWFLSAPILQHQGITKHPHSSDSP